MNSILKDTAIKWAMDRWLQDKGASKLNGLHGYWSFNQFSYVTVWLERDYVCVFWYGANASIPYGDPDLFAKIEELLK